MWTNGEKNEKFRMRRYSKNTATNIYAAHGRDVNNAVFKKKKIQKLSSGYKKTDCSKIYIFLIQMEIICEFHKFKHCLLNIILRDIVNLNCYSRSIHKTTFKMQVIYNICVCPSTACKIFHANTKLHNVNITGPTHFCAFGSKMYIILFVKSQGYVQ